MLLTIASGFPGNLAKQACAYHIVVLRKSQRAEHARQKEENNDLASLKSTSSTKNKNPSNTLQEKIFCNYRCCLPFDTSVQEKETIVRYNYLKRS